MLTRTALLLGFASCVAGQTSPVQKVVQLLTGLEAKIVKQGQESHKTYAEYTEWCEERARNLKFEIQTGKADIEELEADIQKARSTIAAHEAQIEELASGIATDEADLNAAAGIREAEEKDFTKSDAELVDIVSALERAIGILEREMRKGGSAAMLQVQQANGVVQAIKALLDASLIGSSDASKLTALVQSAQGDGDSDSDDWGAPDAAVYEGHSKNIVEVLEDLLDKAKAQMDDARKKESHNQHNFQMLKQSLEDEIKFANQDLDKARKGLAVQGDAKATGEGDLGATKKELTVDLSTQGTLKQDCMTKSQDYEAEVKSRGEELKALGEAKQIIAEQSSGAGAITYSMSQTSFFQFGRSFEQTTVRNSADLANFEAVRFVRQLAEAQHDEALMQLSRRMASAIRYGADSGADPFSKVKGLIKDMLTKLEGDAHSDASHKAYCDEQLGDTLNKKADKEADVDKLSTSIGSKTAKSAQLKQEVADLQQGLASLTKAQSELNQIRSEEKAIFSREKPEMEAGLAAVKMAMKILREYYAQEDAGHEAASGASNGIIGMLEVVESDFSKTIAEMMASEFSAQSAYDQETKANEIDMATSEQAVHYKTRSGAQLDAAASEAHSDREGVQAELSAILQYKAKLEQMCTAKPDTYGERKGRREAELAGLKEALSILEVEAVFFQQHIRGSVGRHVAKASTKRVLSLRPPIATK
eukprot:CAMPEP_0203863698 /NCGR_PEP_ID=MMETSP0359-20131031/14320_1 /ASSEMBLY_ACC=CAM_ASM_000338 /TAXON_ID=268821 /ORGANISM="Scrippsiella Hangoei, Strain SHTV-5" /LENGTH=705 /DNA_ID=CAMNT_0050781293 /DNA_START=85 /DNA_END=2202 /DNA_ORIENTATION=-